MLSVNGISVEGDKLAGDSIVAENKTGLRLETLHAFFLLHLVGGDFPVTLGKGEGVYSLILSLSFIS